MTRANPASVVMGQFRSVGKVRSFCSWRFMGCVCVYILCYGAMLVEL